MIKPDSDTIPTDHEAEKLVVAAVLADSDNYRTAAKWIGPEDFLDDASRAFFKAAGSVMANAEPGRVVMMEDFTKYVRGNGCSKLCTDEWMQKCIDTWMQGDDATMWYAQRVRAAADRRRQIDAAEKFIKAALKGEPINKALTSLLKTTAPPPWSKTERLIVTNAEDVEPKDTQWLWRHRFVKGLNLVCGEPGSNKSSLLYDVTSRITRGTNWPRINNVDDDESVRSEGPGYVAILCAESAADSEIVPRLKAAQADLSRVKILAGEKEVDGTVKLLNLARAVDLIRRELHEKLEGGLRALLIDPIGDFLPGVDSNSDDDVAPALQPLIDFAHECGVAVIMVKHDNKVQTTSAMNKVSGAGAFIRKTRAAWYISKDRTTPGVKRRLMLPLRVTATPHESGMAFVSVPSHADPAQPCLEWEASPVDKTADEAVTERMRGQGDGRRERKQKEVEQLVTDHLTEHGPMPGKELYAFCDQHGYKKSTVQAALHRLEAQTKAIGKGGAWHWKLKDQSWPADISPLEKAAQED